MLGIIVCITSLLFVQLIAEFDESNANDSVEPNVNVHDCSYMHTYLILQAHAHVQCEQWPSIDIKHEQLLC